MFANVIGDLSAGGETFQFFKREGSWTNHQFWSADGHHIRYQQGDKIFDVALRYVGDKLEISAPTELIALPADSIVIAILPDSKRALVARSTSDQTAGSLDLVLNWRAQLY